MSKGCGVPADLLIVEASFNLIGSEEPFQEEAQFPFQKPTDLMGFLIKKSSGFIEPFTKSILRESGKSTKAFGRSSIDVDT